MSSTAMSSVFLDVGMLSGKLLRQIQVKVDIYMRTILYHVY